MEIECVSRISKRLKNNKKKKIIRYVHDKDSSVSAFMEKKLENKRIFRSKSSNQMSF